MNMIPLVRRKIETQITLGADEFGGGGNQKTYLNLATTLRIFRDGFPSLPKMQLDIHNIRIEDAEVMTTIGPRIGEMKLNCVTVKAGDEKRRDIAFRGEIFEAYPVIDGNRCIFRINAMEGIFHKLAAEPMRTIKGSVSALKLLEEYSGKMNYTFRNNGVEDVTLTDIALTGSPMEKMMQIGRAMGRDVEIIVEHAHPGTVRVTKRGAPIEDIPVTVISPDTGMIGYPRPTCSGVAFAHLYSPLFRAGGAIEIRRSLIKRAVGLWTVSRIETFLQCDGAGKNWCSFVDAIYPLKAKEGKADA